MRESDRRLTLSGYGVEVVAADDFPDHAAALAAKEETIAALTGERRLAIAKARR